MTHRAEQTCRVSPELVETFLSFGAATLYEAAGQKGMVDPAIRPAWNGARLCGHVVTVRRPPGDNLALHQAVTVAGPGDVLVTSVDKPCSCRRLGRDPDRGRPGARDRGPGDRRRRPR